MDQETIWISKQPNSNGLYLEDNEGHAGAGSITTDVKPGDTVTWKLKPGGGIDAITSVARKSGSGDIFGDDPEEQPDGSWVGTVSESAGGSESYSIGYQINSANYTDDPELEVKEKK